MTARRRGRQIFGAAALMAALATLWGCATVGGTRVQLPPESVQTPEYYPHLVKGYENTYPARHVLVLEVTLANDSSGVPTAQASGGNEEIGEVYDQDHTVLQRLYSSPLEPLVQNAMIQAADEAGLLARGSGQSQYQPSQAHGDDYVLAAKMLKCWIKKERGPDNKYGPTWRTSAEFAIDATLFKPPFKVPFWQGQSVETFVDPPVDSSGLGSDDETGLYDEPGEVLSVALTRAVAGIFKREDLHTLVSQDQLTHRY